MNISRRFTGGILSFIHHNFHEGGDEDGVCVRFLVTFRLVIFRRSEEEKEEDEGEAMANKRSKRSEDNQSFPPPSVPPPLNCTISWCSSSSSSPFM